MIQITKQHITAVILAGGKGRRLGGQDKGLVVYQNKPLIEHVLARIKPQVNTVLINANRNKETYAKYGYPVITDELSDFQGPLAGFATAMKASNTSHIITLPCDGPFLPEDFVLRLLEKLNASNTVSESIVVAHDGKRLQPVHALIPVSLLDSLEDFLSSGDRKIDRWYKHHPLELAGFSDSSSAFFNINTEQQRQEKVKTSRGSQRKKTT